LFLRDEEVPRAGAHVTGGYQYARWIDGSSHLWRGRRKQAGRGEGSSGLKFDNVTEAPLPGAPNSAFAMPSSEGALNKASTNTT
jgi:hypothetical protein